MRKAQVLRLCRSRIELWSDECDGLALLATQDIDGNERGASALAASIELLLQKASPAGKDEALDLEVVAESAWLAVLPLVIGNAQFGAAPLRALFKHRLEQAYAEPSHAVAGWDIRIEHRPGDGHAIGFAMDPAIRAAIVQAVSGLHHRLRSIQPAFSWNWQRLRTRRRRIVRANGGGQSLWISTEADRTLVAVVSSDQVIALNPAGTLLANDAELSRLAAKESVRLGMNTPSPQVLAVSWHSRMPSPTHRPGPEERTHWLSLAAYSLAPPKAVDASAQAPRTAP